MFDSIAILVSDSGTRTYDVYGNETIITTETTVFVQPRSVYNSEFYNAAQLGLNPSIVLELTNRMYYNGEKRVIFNGILYEVIRTDWNAQRDKISLTLQKAVGDMDPGAADSDKADFGKADFMKVKI